MCAAEITIGISRFSIFPVMRTIRCSMAIRGPSCSVVVSALLSITLIYMLWFCHSWSYPGQTVTTWMSTSKPPVTSQRRRLTVAFHHRLGNLMFQYASMVGVAMTNNIEPFIEIDSEVNSVFHLGHPTEIFDSKINRTNMKTFKEHASCTYDSEFEQLELNGSDGILQGFLQSWKYFNKYKKIIRGHFTFRPEIMKEAKLTFHELGVRKAKNKTLIGVHVRRGDMVTAPFYVDYGYVVAGRDYFENAMTYFRRKYVDVTFLVCSNDIEWAKMELVPVNNDVIFIEGHKPEVDMAILTQCDHTVMSVGTFGWWSAWLAGGEVVYYHKPARPGSKYFKQFNMQDYYPPEWKVM